MLTDETVITIKAGKGGDGSASMRREKYIPKGGPDGGDGGDGGDIFFVCDNNVDTLTHFASQRIFAAENGEPGRPKKMHGANGKDLILRVPQGTLVKKLNGSLIYDFTEIGEKVRLAKGGKGGLGNVHFATSTNQAPRQFTKGALGYEETVKLELKLIADVGLVGFPNAGKSTLISHISNAKPKIADYPFTTVEPNLGIVRWKDRTFAVADIPGLIAGASEGKGLGDKFLKHIERTKVLAHLIDINEPEPLKAYEDIRSELQAWNHDLGIKLEIVVLNKADTLPLKDAQKIAKDLSKKIKKRVFLISAVSGFGIDELLSQVVKELK